MFTRRAVLNSLVAGGASGLLGDSRRLCATPEEIALLRLQRHETLPQWNYAIKPNM